MNERYLDRETFNDFEDKQIIWEVYGELLDFYSDTDFTAGQVASEIGVSKKLVNRALHRLIQQEAVICTGLDHWGVKRYRLNNDFTG